MIVGMLLCNYHLIALIQSGGARKRRDCHACGRDYTPRAGSVSLNFPDGGSSFGAASQHAPSNDNCAFNLHIRLSVYGVLRVCANAIIYAVFRSLVALLIRIDSLRGVAVHCFHIRRYRVINSQAQGLWPNINTYIVVHHVKRHVWDVKHDDWSVCVRACACSV